MRYIQLPVETVSTPVETDGALFCKLLDYYTLHEVGLTRLFTCVI